MTSSTNMSPDNALTAHLTLVAALVLLRDGEKLQCPLAAAGGVQQLEPAVRGEGCQPIGEDLVIRETNPGDTRVLDIGHSAVKPHGAAWHKKCAETNKRRERMFAARSHWPSSVSYKLFLFGFKTCDICFVLSTNIRIEYEYICVPQFPDVSTCGHAQVSLVMESDLWGAGEVNIRLGVAPGEHGEGEAGEVRGVKTEQQH